MEPVAKRQLSIPLPTTIRESILELQLPMRSLALGTGDKEIKLIESPPEDQGQCIAREAWKTHEGPLRLCPLRAQTGFSSGLTNCLRALRMQTEDQSSWLGRSESLLLSEVWAVDRCFPSLPLSSWGVTLFFQPSVPPPVLFWVQDPED